MKYQIIFVLLIIICLFYEKSNIYAYVPEEPAEIIEIDSPQNGMILNTGATINIKIKTKNLDTAQYNKCRVFISNSLRSDIIIDCVYNPDSEYFEGSNILSKEKYAELKYDSLTIGFYDVHPGAYKDVLYNRDLFFIYSDDCYNGNHTGGTAYCNALPKRSICGKEYGSTYGEHNPCDYFELTKPAACTEDGLAEQHCYWCGEVLNSMSIDATGHVYGELEILEYPSCELPGKKGLVCWQCGEIKVIEELNKLEHSAGEWIVTQSPTCTQNGERITKCKNCGITVNTENIGRTGHNFSKWYTLTKPTALLNGKKMRLCFSCKKETTASIPKLKVGLLPKIRLSK